MKEVEWDFACDGCMTQCADAAFNCYTGFIMALKNSVTTIHSIKKVCMVKKILIWV